jgi:hypothetical protein
MTSPKKSYSIGLISDNKSLNWLKIFWVRSSSMKPKRALSGQSLYRLKPTKLHLIRAVMPITVLLSLIIDKKTDRTKYFWLDGGHFYIYNIYMPTNICINIVAGLEN